MYTTTHLFQLEPQFTIEAVERAANGGWIEFQIGESPNKVSLTLHVDGPDSVAEVLQRFANVAEIAARDLAQDQDDHPDRHSHRASATSLHDETGF